MNKRELINDMKRAAGGSFVTRSWLAKYMNHPDPHSVDRFIHNLPRINQRYFIDDIAEQIISQSTYKEVR